MVMKKIKWENVIRAFLLVFLFVVIMRDCYLVIFGSYQWTWLGVGTFMLSLYLFASIFDNLYEQTKSIPSYRPKHAKDTIRK